MKGMNKKILSLLLAFSMLLSLLPAAAFSEPDAEITAFIPIVIDGGTAGSAGYDDAAAAIEYLNTSHASVTASTYGGGEVSVPVTDWTDTDRYNPAIAGSYTFTAALGDIPAGYANPGGLTATAELVVAENAGPEEEVGPGEVDETSLLPPNAMAALEMEGGAIEDGEYTLPVRLWHAVDNKASMGDAALEQTATLVVENGEGTLYLEFGPLTIAVWQMTGYLANLKLAANVQFNELGGIAGADLTDAAVISSYDDVWDSFNHPDNGTDLNVKGKAYPKEVSIPVELGAEYTYVQVYVPVMEALSTGGGTQFARVKLDWSGQVAEEPEDVEITSFDPISIDAGVAGAATYADAAAVTAYLNTSYAGVTANGGEVSVPVAAWADTDNYDPSAAGSYTFTATLGELPAGYINPDNLTATAEVVVNDPEDIADGEYTLPVRLWHAANNVPSMGNAALEQTARLVVAEGQGTLHMTFKSLTYMNQEGYLSQLDLLDNIVFNENNYPVEYDLIPATVLTTYDVVDDFNKPDSSDPNCAGNPYPKDMTIPVVLEQEYTWVHVYVPVMGSMGFGDQVARIKLDWNGLIAVGEPDPDADPAQEINDEDSDGAVELTQGALSGLSGTDNVGLSASGSNMNIPAQYLNEIFAGNPGATLKFEAKESPANTQTAVFQLLGDDDELAGAFDLNLTLGTQSITSLGGRVKITFSLSDAQVTALQEADSRKLCYYDPVTGALTDMNAVFDLAAKTVFFYTDHLSTYAMVSTTSAGPGGPGNSGNNSHGLSNGTYSIEVDALQEYSNDRSMADQFFIEAAELKVSGGTITVTVVMYGTASSPEMPDGIRMSYIKSLQYKNSSGSWANAINSRNEAEDSLKVKMTVSSLDDVYMRVQTDYMGPDYKVFRLVFNKGSIKGGGVSFGSGVTRSAEDQYTITATAGEGGSISPSGDVKVNKGDDQTFAISPDEGYIIKDVLVKDESVGPVSEYTFADVEEDGTIAVTFEKIEEVLVPIEKAAGIPMELKFTDTAGHWAEKVIHFVVERGLFAGTCDTLFSPDAYITRGMFVTVLGRISQIDPAGYSTPRFADVDPELYYAPYINWAASYDIVKGVGDGRFEPNREITREEMAVIFVKYANFAGIDLSGASAVPTTAVTPATPTAPTAPETAAPTAAAPEGALKDGRYTIEASALMENKDDFSMTDQFLTEPAILTVAGGKITAGMVWHGTEYVTMDMLEELKIVRSSGELVDVEKVVNQEENTLTIIFEVEDLKQATVMQVYVPRGMGEMRPKFRLVFDSATLKEQAAAETGLRFKTSGIKLLSYDPAAPTAVLTAAAAESGLQDGRYTVEASALMENKDDFSMADQFLTEPASLTVAGGRITAGMVWHGTEYVTMDMLEELKIQRSSGELADVEKVVNLEENTLTITFEVEDLKQATVMQVYVPRGMGEMRPKFRLVFDSASLKEQASAGPDLDEQGAAPEASLQEPVSAFADAGEISDWARESVEKMRTAGFIQGKGNNRFDPRGFTTRAEAAVILAKSVGYTD